MGTRNLTCVFLDGMYKIAQYGQYDGGPSGEGVNVLKFLRKNNMVAFQKQLRNVYFVSDEYIEEKCNEVSKKGLDWTKYLPEFSRDTGSEILKLVRGGVTELRNNITFAGHSLMCEWAYVIDYDKKVFEVYRGFNKKQIKDTGRFLSRDFERQDYNKEYHPIVLFKSYSAYDMPSDSQFLQDMGELLEEERKKSKSRE